MGLVQTDYGDGRSLLAITDAWRGSAGLVVHLFVAPYAPNEGTVVGDMLEASFPGYSARPAGPWSPPTLVGGKAMTVADPILWVHAGGAPAETVYGYWVEPSDDPGEVWWAEALPTPVPLAVAGDALLFYLRYTQDTE